jgi:RiboL-PSP-HEPN
MSSTAPECQALEAFYQNLQESTLLRDFYEYLKRQHYDPQVLLKSGIIFIVTCLDEFVKHLVTEAFDIMLNSSQAGKNHLLFPIQVRIMVAEYLLENSGVSKESWFKDKWKQEVWQLAGDGWLTLLKQHREAVMQRYVERFQSLRQDNIDKLFEHVIGLKQLSHHWQWPGMSNSEAIRCLNTLMDLRGDLVHRNVSHRPIVEEDVSYFSLFATQLAILSVNGVREYLYNQLGEYPWEIVSGENLKPFEIGRCTPKNKGSAKIP